MRIVYFDCFAGISGDMTLGALVDAGVDVEQLKAGLATLPLPEWELQVGRTLKNGFAAADVEVIVGGVAAGATSNVVPDAPVPGGGSHTHEGHTHAHTHDHTHDEPTHSHEHSHSHTHTATHSHSHAHADEEYAHTHSEGHSHDHTHTPTHPHTHKHAHDDHPHTTRDLGSILAIIHASELPAAVKEKAERVYRRLAEAEARVHNTTVERIHFHEVGAVDAIVDIVGSVYGLHLLGVERIVSSELPTARGFTRSAHGPIPLPAPATLDLLRGVPTRPVESVRAELVTPTGAALITALADEYGPIPPMRIDRIGYGAGTKDFPFPNVLRIMIGVELDAHRTSSTTVTLIEANIDDQSPQVYEHVMERLFEAGALDVYLQPIQMKKNRPAQTLAILCAPSHADALTDIVFAETTTLGVRTAEMRRACLEREWLDVETRWGPARVKVGRQGDAVRTVAPEYEDCRRLARESSVPLKDVQAEALALARQQLRVA